MIRRKLLVAGLLMAGFVATGFTTTAQAATSAEQILQVELGGFVDIEADDKGSCLSGDIDTDTGKLEKDLTSKFDIKANCKQDLYLYAKAGSASGPQNAFYEDDGAVYVALASIDNVPTDSAFNNVVAGNASNADDNPNVIAYQVSGVALSGASSGNTPVFSNTEKQYEINAEPGLTSATTTIATDVALNTYSYVDTAGTYQATVTLTSTSL
ncbi:MAG: hypothetical protein R3Y28_00670 [Candidatus Gastranaerophilales bacterium]